MVDITLNIRSSRCSSMCHTLKLKIKTRDTLSAIFGRIDPVQGRSYDPRMLDSYAGWVKCQIDRATVSWSIRPTLRSVCMLLCFKYLQSGILNSIGLAEAFINLLQLSSKTFLCTLQAGFSILKEKVADFKSIKTQNHNKKF